MRILLLFLFIVLIQPALAITTCCVEADPNTGTGCYEVQSSAECEGTAYGGLFCNQVSACDAGCCCATPYASNPDEWNLEETRMLMIRASCEQLNANAIGGLPYSFEPLQGSCTLTCSNINTTPTQRLHTISGYVKNGNEPIKDATVMVAFTGFQGTTNAQGYYEITDVPELQGELVASHYECETDTASINLDRNIRQDFTLNCDIQMCTVSSNPTVAARAIPASPDVELTFSAGLNCGLPRSYNVVRVDKTHGRLITFTVPYAEGATYIDEDLPPDTEFCYKVAAEYTGRLVPANLDERAEACITTGSALCMQADGEELEWCDNEAEAAMRCDENNQAEAKQQCTGDQVCSYLGSGRYGCITRPMCEECNGLFGMLSNRVFTVFFLGTEHSCSSAEVQNYCFKDQSDTIIDAYRECSEISNCEHYRTATQCGKNPCAIQSTCQWKDVYPEIGKGICTSLDKPAACDQCESVFGTCNTELCHAISAQQCYYDSFDNGLDTSNVTSRCRHIDDMACRYYDTPQDCGAPSRVDVQYAGDERYRGTHAVVQPSNDLLGIGLCEWNPVSTMIGGGFCYKDADEYVHQDPEDDCIDNGVFAARGGDVKCLQDSEPPETGLITAETTIGVHEVAGLGVAVSDNYYTAEELAGNTRFCIDQTGTCYPDSTLAAVVADIPDMEIGETGTFYIRFYSYDLSGNLEPIKQSSITLIELGVPRVENAEIRE